MNTRIVTIPHRAHRYKTVGDWFKDADGFDMIEVSAMSDPRYELLVAFHEFIESELCKQRGISEARVTAFDKKFEKERAKFLHSADAEPGNDPRAPYRKEHFTAETMERLLAVELGVDWAKYSVEVGKL